MWSQVSESEKTRVGYTNADDGFFFIPFLNYLKEFGSTHYCLDNDKHYIRRGADHTFDMEDTEPAYFLVDIEEPLNGASGSNLVEFGITVCQQGDRLGTYRRERWEPCSFHIALIEVSSCTIINNSYNYSHGKTQRFQANLTVDSALLRPGLYMIVVIPDWNENPKCKLEDENKIYMQVLCPA